MPKTRDSSILRSQRPRITGIDQRTPLCEYGHQGKAHDEQIDLIHYPARPLHPKPGWLTGEPYPVIYPDGMNACAPYMVNHPMARQGFTMAKLKPMRPSRTKANGVFSPGAGIHLGA